MPVAQSPLGSGPAHLEVAARRLANNGGGVLQLGSELEELLATFAEEATVAGAIGGGVAASDAAVGVGSAFIAFFGWWILLIALVIILLLRIFEGWLVKFAGWIPTFGIGNVQGAVRTGFHWLDLFENWVIHQLGDAVLHIFHGLGLIIYFALGIDPTTLDNLLSGKNVPSGYATRGQVLSLQGQINQLRQQLNEFEYGTTATPHNVSTVRPPAPISVQVQQQYQHIEAQLSTLHRDVQQLNKRLDYAEHQITSANTKVDTLASQVHQVRAVAVGWQELEHTVDELGNTVSTFIDTTTVQLRDDSRRLVALQPLTLLLQPGIRGLKNLRTLEDQMCQCPKIPGLPSLEPEKLALYEFMTNG